MSTWNQNFFFFILILLINKILLRPILPPTNIKSTMIFDSTIYDNEEKEKWDRDKDDSTNIDIGENEDIYEKSNEDNYENESNKEEEENENKEKNENKLNII